MFYLLLRAMCILSWILCETLIKKSIYLLMQKARGKTVRATTPKTSFTWEEVLLVFKKKQ